MKNTYEALTQAIDILARAQRELNTNHPAWDIVWHAKQRLQKQASEVLRSEVSE